MVEVWKSVVAWEGFYEISDQCRVKSLTRIVAQGEHTISIQERILKQTKHGCGYLAVRLCKNGVSKLVSIHRLMFLAFIDSKCRLDIDHIDGNILNNRLNNLRTATKQQNQANRKKTLNTSSEFKGVYFNKQKGKWRCQIMVNYKNKHLGLFPTQEQAAQAYNKAAIKYFGEFAKLNEI